MAAALNISPPYCSTARRPPAPATKRSRLPSLSSSVDALGGSPNPRWASLQRELKCEGRHSCFFADGRKEEQARKALESALGGKKTEFEKWNKEIQKREEMGGGGASGAGGWFGGGGWFGWFGREDFWDEAQQAILAIIGIVSLYLLITKGSLMFVVVSNSVLFVLRGSRNWFTFVSSCFSRRAIATGSGSGSGSGLDSGTYQHQMSAKERVVKKWGMD